MRRWIVGTLQEWGWRHTLIGVAVGLLGVRKVRFTGGAEDPLRILLDFKDGAFAVFDADGKPVQPEGAVSAPPLPASTGSP